MIVETCLIGHGIPSVSNDELVERWPISAPLGLVLDGKIELLEMKEYVQYRGHDWPRLDYFTAENIPAGTNAYLTASGTMKAAEILGHEWAVSCGLGGIFDKLRGESICPDLQALGTSPVKLMSTAFKDMMDFDATFEFLRHQGSNYTFVGDSAPGYIFDLSAQVEALDNHVGTCAGGLYLRGIPVAKRLTDLDLLSDGIAFGLKEERAGKHFHPIVNGYFDRMTEGYSSQIQFEAILSNVEYLLKNN